MKPTLEAINQFWMVVANHKKEMRTKQAALSSSEKIKIFEKLRDRDRMIAGQRTPREKTQRWHSDRESTGKIEASSKSKSTLCKE